MLWMELSEQARDPKLQPSRRKMIKSDHAAAITGVDTETLRQRAKRENWPMGTSGKRMLTYPADILRDQYPNADFDLPPPKRKRSSRKGSTCQR
jgi:hypothetical protein